MKMNTGLFQQQSLKLVMTKELTQAITLLQYSSQDLSHFLEELTIENPLLELKHSDSRIRKRTKIKNESYINPIDYVEKNEETLAEYLFSQLADTRLSSNEKKTIKYIILLLDDNGYLYFSSEEIAKQLQIDTMLVEKAIGFIQTLEPVGIGARNLQECLLLQLRSLPQRNLLAETIIADHFVLFAEKSWQDIAKKLNIKLSDIQVVFDFVQRLKPRPGSIFQGGTHTYIIPDIEIQVDNSTIIILIKDDYLPKVSIDPHYHQHLVNEDDPKIKSYLQDKVNQYQWIVKSMEQRKQTLHKVMKEIVARQREYFLNGPTFLKPLTMNEVAEAIEIHESTVSRAVKDKYVQTPYGIVEMKSFFSGNIQTTGIIDASSSQVKELVKQLVENENKGKPLSDQEIVDILGDAHGILVSRRTIAKYRNQLKIPSSTKRKRYDK